MTKQDAAQVLAILKAAYPASYQGMTTQEATGTVTVWQMQFADMPVDIVLLAVHKLISSNKFPPTVAEVKQKLQSIHWETYDLVGNDLIDPKQKQVYQRIFEATKPYQYAKVIEPKIAQMLPHTQRLGLNE